VLEREGRVIGVVTGIQGKRTFRATVRGEEAHAGTSLRRDRKDALLAALRIIDALTAVMHDDGDIVKFTVGRFDVLPNAPSVVPSEVTFSIDLRHVDSATLTALGDRIPSICAGSAGPCAVEVVELSTAMSLDFPKSMTRLIRDSARKQGWASMDIYSAAGHDARYLHGVCPTAMIFVPCKDGISHSPAESAKAEDLAAGAQVLVSALVELAKE
jgi:N-carbamoyl-L-amino-acid hydrolase